MEMARMRNWHQIGLVFIISVAMTLLVACSSEPEVIEVVKEVPVDRVVTQEVVKEVPVERIVTQEVEVEKIVTTEVPVEKIVTREVVKEVPVEKIVTREVVKEVPVERIVTKEVEVEKVVTKEVEKEVVKVVEVQGRRGGSLVDARTTDATSLDPHNVPAAANFRIRGHVYNGLVSLDSGMSVQPDLASSWSIPDPTTYVFSLREGVMFHNGEPLTADDVKYTYERILDESTGSFIRGGILNISEINPVDAHTIEFKLENPEGGFLSRHWSIGIVPKSVADQPKDWLNSNVVGTGPWVLQEWKTDVEHSVARNENFYEPGIPLMDGFRVQVIPEESSIIAGIRTGIIDHAKLEDAQNFSLLQKNPNVVLYQTPAMGTNFVNINHRSGTGPGPAQGPLSDIRVRQALSLGMDRDAILNLVGAGLGTVSGHVPPSLSEYWVPPEDLPFFERDIERAKQLLAEAGYSDGFSMDIIYIPEFAVMQFSAELLAEQWKEIGLDAVARSTEYGVWLDERVETFPYFVSTNLTFNMADPDHILYNCFHSSGSCAQWDAWSDPEMDALLEKARQETDPAMRVQLWKDVQIMLAERIPALTSFAPIEIDVVQKWVRGYTPHPSAVQFGFKWTWIDR